MSIHSTYVYCDINFRYTSQIIGDNLLNYTPVQFE